MSDEAADGSAVGLFQTERQRHIVTLTLETGRAEVSDLANRFGVTTETIRRDLSDLQRQRVLRRVHGGAIPWEAAGFEPLLSVRTDQYAEEKRRLARMAVAELPSDGAIIVDSGSTLTTFAEALPADCALHIVTNSLPTAQVLAEFEQVSVVVVGGKLRKNTRAMVDAETVAVIRQLNVETLFISCDGLSLDQGLTTPYRAEAMLKRAMIQAARRVVALVDHSKVGRNHLVRFAEWTDIDVLVTNTEVDPDIVGAISELGTDVRLA